MADQPINPNDANLSILNARQQKAMESFTETIESVEGLFSGLKGNLEELQKSIQSAKNNIGGGGGGGGGGGPSVPPGTGGGGGGGGGGGPSVPPGTGSTQSPGPGPYDQDADPNNRQAGPSTWYQREIAKNPYHNKPVEMPRYGEMTMQDYLNMGSRAMSGIGGVPEAGQDPGNMIQRAAGQAAGGLSKAAGMAPYLTTAMGWLGLPPNPADFGAYAQGAGLTSQSGAVNFDDPFSSFKGAEFAAKQGLLATTATAGLHGHASLGEVKTFEGEMLGMGVRPGSEQASYTEMFKNLKRTDQAMPENMAQLLREGTMSGLPNTQDDTQEALKKLAHAADAAGLSVDEMGQSTAAASESLQQMGMTKAQGENAAVNFSASTGLDPQVMTQVAQNPLMKANLFAQSGGLGALPGTEALAMKNPGQFNSAMSKTMNQLFQTYRGGIQGDTKTKDAYGNTIKTSADAQAWGAVGSQMGMDGETARRYAKHQAASQSLGDLQGLSDEVHRESIRIGKSDMSQEDKQAAYQDLYQGTGKFKDKANVSQMSQTKNLDKFISPEDQAALARMSPQDRATQFQKLTHKKNILGEDVEQGKALSENGVQISLSPAAKKFFQLTGGDRGTQGRGGKTKAAQHAEGGSLIDNAASVIDSFGGGAVSDARHTLGL